ncbi:MAG: phosphatidate cytidylyltransferase [Bacteroidetes bacterium]|nr:MAG: phosphatidate cytidylyltransferase [Bacteroidota bacterium]
MKNSLYGFLFIMISMSLTSCEVVGGIFKAGVWVGILAVAAVIGLIIFLISKLSGKK